MPLERVRPSLLASAGPSLLGKIALVANQLGKSEVMLRGVEQGIQDEHDE